MTAPATLDLQNSEGYEQLWSNGSQQNLTFDNVSEQVTVGAKGIAATAAVIDVDVNYVAGTVAAADTQAIVLEDATVEMDINQGGAATGVRNVAVTSTGVASAVGFVGNDLVTGAVVQNLTIDGAGDLVINNAITAGTVDASEATGNLNLTVANTAAGNLATGVTARSVTLGAGDDVLTALGNISVGSFVGGEGTDTINVDGTSGTLVDDLVANVSGFEVLGLDALNGAVSAATLANVGFQSLVLTDANGGTVNNIGASTEVSLVNTGANSSATFNLVAGVEDLNLSLEKDLAGVSTFTVVNTNAVNLTVDFVENDDSTADATLAVTAAADLETVTITGTQDVSFDGSGLGELTSVDASALVGDATLEVGNGVTVTGSAGDDSITFAESAEVTGGAGEDVFVASLVTATDAGVPRFSSITDLNADEDDSVEFGAAGTVLSTATTGTDVNIITEADLGLAPGATVTFADFLNMASDQAAGTLSGFEFAGNTYLVEDNTATTTGPVAGNTFDATADFIVELTGSVDLTEFTYA
nr:hypothetical protein [Halomonas sp.]